MLYPKVMIGVNNVFIVICCCIFWVNGLDPGLQSPCPAVFVYRYQDHGRNTWYGTLIITTDKKSFEVNSIRILLDREAVSLKLYDHMLPGVVVDTFDNTEYLIDGLRENISKDNKLSVTISLTYTTNGPVPKLTAYRVNEITFCSQTSYVAPDGHYVNNEPANNKHSTTLVQQTNKPQWSVAVNNAFTSAPVQYKPTPPPLSHSSCGVRVPDVTPLIINGKPSRRGEWPWHGALYASEYQCGVSLVHPQYVITAAHCVTKALRSEEPIEPGKLRLVFGRNKLSNWNDPGIQNTGAERIIVHPKYNSTNLHNDIAIIKLSHKLEVTLWVRTVCLWLEDYSVNSLVNRTGTVVGWGVTAKGDISEKLLHAEIPVIDPFQCISTDTLFYSQYYSPSSFCAGIRKSTSACNGDSGGGMVFRRKNTDIWQLRGVVSLAALDRDTNICDINRYVVFTDVAHYTDWLANYIPAIR